MSENRDIEQRLRDYGKKRRSESAESPELHPATRRLLQGEVTRVYGAGQAASPSFSNLARRNWTRFGLAFALFVGLGIAAVLLLQTEAPVGTSTQMVGVRDELAAPPPDDSPAELAVPPQATPSPVELRPEAAPPPAAPGAVVPAPSRESRVVALQDSVAISTVDAKAEAAAGAKMNASDGFRRVPELKQKEETQLRIAGSVAPPAEMLTRDQQPTDTMQRSADSRGQAATAPVTLPNPTRPENRPIPAPATSPAPLTVASKGVTSTSTSQSVFFSTDGQSQTPAQNRSVVATPSGDASGGVLPTWDAERGFDGQFTRASAEPGSAGQDKFEAFGSGAAEDVLSGFQFSYVGGEVKVTDRDGSVYAGRASPTVVDADQPLADPAAGASPTATSGTPRMRRPLQAGRTLTRHLAFEVIGTNRTLNQRVRFNGVMGPPADVQESDVAKRLQAVAPAAPPPTPQPSLRADSTRSRATSTRTEAGSTSQVGIVRGGASAGASVASSAAPTNSVLHIQGRVKIGTQPERPLRWAGESVNR